MHSEDTLQKYGQSFQTKTISALLSDERMMDTLSDVIHKKFFESEANKWIVEEIVSHHKEYNKVPSLDVFKVQVSKIDNQSLQKTIAQIDIYISIFTAIVAIIKAIPVPTAVPPGIGVPVSLIMRITDNLIKISKLIVSLNIVTAIALISLENEIIKLEELILRLKDISQNLTDKSLTNLDQQQLTELTNFFTPVGVNDFPPYKGFNFKIKEDDISGKIKMIISFFKDCVDDLKKYETLSENDLKKIALEARKISKGDDIEFTQFSGVGTYLQGRIYIDDLGFLKVKI